jgi:uncharacterized protein (TIRG00374 family)
VAWIDVNARNPDLDRAPQSSPPASTPRVSVGRILFLLVTGFFLYLLAPSIAEVFEAWGRLGEVDARWFPVILGAEALAFGCMWTLQRMVLRRSDWFPVIMTELAGNAFNKITPGGGATGTALQARMLADAGTTTAAAASGLTVESILNSSAIAALPFISLVLLAITGTNVPGSLSGAAWVGVFVFILVLGVMLVFLRTRRPLLWLGHLIEGAASRLPRGHRIQGLGERLVQERDKVRQNLGSRWARAVSLSTCRWLFEYFALLATLVAIGASPDPVLTLLAFTIAALLTLVPLTPGGLGFVEAGLTGTLVAAGISAPAAVLATLVFRLVSFWLPLPIGVAAAYVYRRRYPRRHAIVAS